MLILLIAVAVLRILSFIAQKRNRNPLTWGIFGAIAFLSCYFGAQFLTPFFLPELLGSNSLPRFSAQLFKYALFFALGGSALVAFFLFITPSSNHPNSQDILDEEFRKENPPKEKRISFRK